MALKKLVGVKSRSLNKGMLRKAPNGYSKSKNAKQEMLERCKKIKESINAESR